MNEIKETEYGLKYRVLEEPEEWDDPYDILMGKVHMGNFGCVIVDAEYGTPIDNEYDLEAIASELKLENPVTGQEESHER